MSLFELRRNDYSLDEDMTAVNDLFADFFTSECSTGRVRAAEPLGYDAELWKSLSTIGVVSMGLPESVGGDAASLATLTLVAEPMGARLAPVPLLSQLAAARLLSRFVDTDERVREVLTAVVDGDRFVTLALAPVRAGARQLVADGALADAVLGLADGELHLYLSDVPGAHVHNQSSSPLAWWSTDLASVDITLSTSDTAIAEFSRARDEFRLLTAAALVGMTQTALGIACEFVRSRYTMGVPVGSLQGVSFPLSDVAINLDGTRNLLRRAAWFVDDAFAGDGAHGADAETVRAQAHELALAAFAAAARTATHGTTTSAHMQGGLGFTIEADASLFFLRTKGWIEQAGNPDADLAELGRSQLARAAG